MEVGDEATKHLSKTFRDSLPTIGNILGKMNSAGKRILGLAENGANASLPHLKKAGRLAEEGANASILHLKKAGRLAEEAVNASLPHLKKGGSLAEEVVNASLPHLKKAGSLAEQGMNASLPHLKKAGSLAEQGVNASLPHLKKVGGMAEQGVKSAAGFTEDGVRATLPYMRTSLDYSVEKAKQHPYLFGSLALIILFRSIMIPALINLSVRLAAGMKATLNYLFWRLTDAVKAAAYNLFKLFRGGGSGLWKTMKAPGQNIRIPRAPFELNPKAYFSALRALKGK